MNIYLVYNVLPWIKGPEENYVNTVVSFSVNQSENYTTAAHITQQRPLRSEAKHPRTAMTV